VDAQSLTHFKSRFLVGVVSTAMGTLAPMLISLVGVMFILRWLQQGDFGVYLMLMVIIQLLSTFFEFGIRTSVIRNLQSMTETRDQRQMVNSSLWVTLALAVIASGMALGGREVIFKVYDFELLRSLIWYLPPILILTNLNNIAHGALQGVHSYSVLMVIRLIAAALRFGMVIFFLKSMELGVYGLLYADILSLGFSYVASVLALPGRGAPEFARRVMQRILGFGLPLYLNSLLSFTFNKVDVMMIGNMADVESVAGVEVAGRIPANLKAVLSSSFMSVFFPHMSELLVNQQTEKARRFLEMSLRVVAFVIMFVALCVAMLQDEIVLLIFSESYLSVGPAFTIFMMALAIGMSGTLMGTTLVAAGHPGAPAKINLVAVSANIIGNLILIPRMGFTGAALATLLMTILSLPVNHWFLSRKLFHVRGAQFLVPIGIGLLLWGVRQALHIENIWMRLLLIPVYAVSCVAVVGALRQDLLNVYQSSRAMLAKQTR
jgi:O-antigen/teichoic acid export membrane protein